VGFTPLSAMLSPERMVEILNEVYSHFDALAEKYDVEKIAPSATTTWLLRFAAPQR